MNDIEHQYLMKEMWEECHEPLVFDPLYAAVEEQELEQVTVSKWKQYPDEITVTFDLSPKLKDIQHLLNYDITEVMSLRYGGRQFGYYSDMGDKRSALVKDEGVRGVTIVKGGFTTPLCDYGSGYYNNAFKEAEISRRLRELGVPSQKVLQVIKRREGYTSILWRPSPFRFGTIEYIYRHHPKSMRKVWELTKVHAGHPSMLDQELWRLIEGGYHDLCDMWEAVGFTHGCLNTDNLCLLPCGIDYGHSYFNDEEEHNLKFDPHQFYGHTKQREIIRNNLQALKEILSLTLSTLL